VGRISPAEECRMIRDWSELPIVVEWPLVADLIGVKSYDAVRGHVQRGQLPAPALTHPMRWYRSDLERHMRFTTVATMRRSA